MKRITLSILGLVAFMMISACSLYTYNPKDPWAGDYATLSTVSLELYDSSGVLLLHSIGATTINNGKLNAFGVPQDASLTFAMGGYLNTPGPWKISLAGVFCDAAVGELQPTSTNINDFDANGDMLVKLALTGTPANWSASSTIVSLKRGTFNMKQLSYKLILQY